MAEDAQGDGRPFWRIVVAEATGCTDNYYFEEVHQYYTHGNAWCLPVGGDTTLCELKDAGGHKPLYLLPFSVQDLHFSICLLQFNFWLSAFRPLSESLSSVQMAHILVKLAVVSNFDTRLRKLLKDLNVSDMFDAIVVSSEVGFEKPAPDIFKIALNKIGVEASNAVHVGDDETADKAGANAIGLECWLWDEDVKTFYEIRDRIL
ncbi:uncharacterized protein LOC133895452 isoform X2 [Phragmites australis]|uniref:uncharacterized protein LOC133895452 isoform X2 n=1 Tax=Phragmites australis TaxID=29695 RepID=UPI002D77A5D2|nr:uncharacterized protein LOC133895452 isoform X2 [Phragmites australis]